MRTWFNFFGSAEIHILARPKNLFISQNSFGLFAWMFPRHGTAAMMVLMFLTDATTQFLEN